MTVESLESRAMLTFGPPVDYLVGMIPTPITTGDFNSDGKLDVATANSAGTVSVLNGIGDGRFEAATNFGVGSNPSSVIAADFDGNGSLDLATANSSSDNVSVLLGRGNGSFEDAKNFVVGTTPLSMAVGDFDGDGNADIVTANFRSNTVSVLLGYASGGFASIRSFEFGASPNSVIVADVNGDGKPDLVTANSSRTLSVLIGIGGGDFEGARNIELPAAPEFVTAGDFDGDGKLDLAAVTLFSNVSVLLGSDNFTVATSYNVGSRPSSLAVGDFNGDGNPDLVTSSTRDTRVSVLLGNGSGGFASVTTFPVGQRQNSVTVGDFNGDGNPDLATANLSSTVSVLLNLGKPPVITASAISLGEGSARVLGSSNLNATDPDSSPAQLTYSVSGVSGGQFELVAAPSVAITEFTQAQINAGAVRFVQDGSETASVSSLTVKDNGGNSTSAQLTITVSNVAPSNALITVSATPINENGTTSISGSFVDPGTLDTHTVIIDWGDGSSETVGLAAGVLTIPSTLHQYKDSGTFTITVTVTDKDNDSTSTTASVVVTNVAPSSASITVSATPINENGTTSISGSFVDPGTLDTHTVLIDWGDGSSETVTLAAGVLSIPSTLHQYKDSGTFAITVTVTDKDNDSTSTTASVVVNNVAPSNASITVSATPINENGTTSISGSFVDPGTLDTHTVLIDWGDGSSETVTLAAGVLTIPSTPHQYKDSGTFTITVTVTDKDNDSTSTTASVVVINVAPALSNLAATAISENGVTTLTGTITDPGTLDTFTLEVNWGDPLSPGNLESYTFAAGTTTFSLTHRYLDDNPTGSASDVYTISLKITDKDSGSSNNSTTVTINNVAPVISSLTNVTPGSFIGINQPVTLNGLFTDVGTLDTFRVTTDWGDGTTSTGTVSGSGGSGSFTNSSVYRNAGLYTITTRLLDDDGAVDVRTTTVNVTGASIVNGTLTVVGTPANDSIIVSITGNVAVIQAAFVPNGIRLFTGVQRIAVYSLDGNDSVASLSTSPTLPLLVDAGNGNDVVGTVGSPATLIGGNGNDQLTATSVASQLFGGDGDDFMSGSDQSDSLDGGAGNDQIFGLAGDDQVLGGAGNDRLDGGAGNDVLEGGENDDTLLGGDGNDSLSGGAGDDKAYGGAGIDRVLTGAGNDLANIDNGVDSFVISAPFTLAGTGLSSTGLAATINWGNGTTTPGQVRLINGVATVSGSRIYPAGGLYTATVTLRDAQNRSLKQNYQVAVVGAGVVGNVLQVVGTFLGEAINIRPVRASSWSVQVGSNPARVITNSAVQGIQVSAFDGDDTIHATVLSAPTNFAVVVDAGAGNDRVFTTNGAQAILGGEGDDYLVATGGYGGIEGGAGNDFIQLNTALGGLANGGDGNDQIRGSALADTLDGGAGDDTLFGQGGNDLLRGGDGIDTLDGGDGNDILLGGSGNDNLRGGTGRDLLIGGQGIDAISASGSGALLIGGSTVHDNNDAALRAIMDEWSSPASFATRVSNLRGPGLATRKNGNFFINQSTLIDDQAADALAGSIDADWFWSLAPSDFVILPGPNDRIN